MLRTLSTPPGNPILLRIRIHESSYSINILVITFMIYSQSLAERSGRIMSDHPLSKPARPWRVIAEEASHEFDSRKMADLLRELNQALEEQGVLGSGGPGQEKKSA